MPLVFEMYMPFFSRRLSIICVEIQMCRFIPK